MPDHSILTIAAQRTPLSKAQLLFNRRVSKIQSLRESLQKWQAFERHHHQRVTTEMLPLQREVAKAQRQLVHCIDGLLTAPRGSAAHDKALGRGPRTQLSRLLLGLLETLLDDAPDAELAAVFDRYSPVSQAELQREELEITEVLLAEMLGRDALRGHGASTAADLLQQAAQEMQRQAEQEEASKARRRAARADKRGAPGKAEAAQDKKLQATQAAAKEASQSVREVYRKLASALHPDRASDAADQERRTAMMKRVNQAYDSNDLLALLSIQIEIEQIDSEHLAQVSAERLAHYNQVLMEQQKQLELEQHELLAPFRAMLGMPAWGGSLSLVDVSEAFNEDLGDLRFALETLRSDTAAFSDPKTLLVRLKQIAREERDNGFQDSDGMDDLGDILMGLQMAQAMPPKRRRRP